MAKRGVNIPAELQAEIKRRWLANERIVSIAKSLNLSRNTIMRYASSNYATSKR